VPGPGLTGAPIPRFSLRHSASRQRPRRARAARVRRPFRAALIRDVPNLHVLTTLTEYVRNYAS
jgi:hypothetical protein